jgi:hypothetical protein
MYICDRVRMYAYVCTYAHTHVLCTYVSTTYVCMYVNIHAAANMQLSIRIHTYVYIFSATLVVMYVCMVS